MKNMLRQIVLSTALCAAGVAAAAPAIEWQPWSESVFERARNENRFVLLDLEAVWCHWCHVMDQETCGDPEVRELIAQHYIAIRVDRDARPDLSRRYEDYGWPAIPSNTRWKWRAADFAMTRPLQPAPISKIRWPWAAASLRSIRSPRTGNGCAVRRRPPVSSAPISRSAIPPDS
jgi:hypothetical protein